MKELTVHEKQEKREEMRIYQRVYYLKRKFEKDCWKMAEKNESEKPKTIQIRKGEFTVVFQ